MIAGLSIFDDLLRIGEAIALGILDVDHAVSGVAPLLSRHRLAADRNLQNFGTASDCPDAVIAGGDQSVVCRISVGVPDRISVASNRAGEQSAEWPSRFGLYTRVSLLAYCDCRRI